MDTDKLKNIPPLGWALVVAGAALGGALLHGHRMIGAVLGGGVAFAFEWSQAPCCDGCAAGAGCGGASTTNGSGTSAGNAPGTTPQPIPVTGGHQSGNDTGIVPPGLIEPSSAGSMVLGVQQPITTAPLTTSDVGSVKTNFDPLSLWTMPAFNDAAAQPAAGKRPCKGC